MVDNYVKEGLALAWQVYDTMNDGESVEILHHNKHLDLQEIEITKPNCEHVPHGYSIHGLETPVRIGYHNEFRESVNYMELASFEYLNSKEGKFTLGRSTPAYIWFAENGTKILEKLAERRNKATVTICLLPEQKEKLEKMAEIEGCSLTDLVLKSLPSNEKCTLNS